MLEEHLQSKIESIISRYDELDKILSVFDVSSDVNKYLEYSKEQANLLDIYHASKNLIRINQTIESNNSLIVESDEEPEIKSLALEENASLAIEMEALIKQIKCLLVPKDPLDSKNVYLEIRAAAGGNEAAIFASDLLRMYLRYIENMRWKAEIISMSDTGIGGCKEVIVYVSGKNVYSKLKFESGAHRVQRVPITESQGRLHTSTCTVAILPEADLIGDVEINTEDLRIDTFRSSGAGGQHVQKTDSAVRITHIPTGIVVECQDERSQHKNKARAISLLQSKIMAMKKEESDKQIANNRRNLVGTGDRSERIRTYNFPQSRVTDHRINYTIYKLQNVIDGELELLIDKLTTEYYNDLFA